MIEAKEPNVVCCGQEMQLMEEKTQEQGEEKHVPILKKTEYGVSVTVGSVAHPMEENHYIKLVEVLKGDNVIAGKWLYPGDKPEATFCLHNNDNISARIYCNIHGAWKN